ncbi:hypothetical protein BGX38DRAFT_1220086, partial [Terfezia claveryi]
MNGTCLKPLWSKQPSLRILVQLAFCLYTTPRCSRLQSIFDSPHPALSSMDTQYPSLMTSQRLRPSESATSSSSLCSSIPINTNKLGNAPFVPTVNLNDEYVLWLSFINPSTSTVSSPPVVLAYRPAWLQLIPRGTPVSSVVTISLSLFPLDLFNFTERLSEMFGIPIHKYTSVELLRGGSRIYICSVRELISEFQRIWWSRATFGGNGTGAVEVGAAQYPDIKNSCRNTDTVGKETSERMGQEQGGPFGFTGQIVYMVRQAGAASAILPQVDGGMDSPVVTSAARELGLTGPPTYTPGVTWSNTALQRRRAYIDIRLCCSATQSSSPKPPLLAQSTPIRAELPITNISTSDLGPSGHSGHWTRNSLEILIRNEIDEIGAGLMIEKLVITFRGKEVDDCVLGRLYNNLVGSISADRSGEQEQGTEDELAEVILAFEAFVMCSW